jgi:hypothetical protein
LLELAAVEELFDGAEIQLIKAYVTDILRFLISIKKLQLPFRPSYDEKGERSRMIATEEQNWSSRAGHECFSTAGFCELPFKLMAFCFVV